MKQILNRMMNLKFQNYWKVFFVILSFHTMNLNNLIGQISTAITTDRDRYIQFEPIKVTVSLKNYSGHSIAFQKGDSEEGFLAIQVKNLKGRALPNLMDNFNPVRDLTLSPGVVKTLNLILSDYFNLQAQDDYEMRIRVGHRRFKNDFLSHPVYFKVRSGVAIWEQEVGLPNFNSQKTIETRTCSLNIFHQNDGDIFFFQNEDENYVYSILRLGPRVHGSQPQCKVDALSRIHTLIQTGSRLFNYKIIDLFGKTKHNSFYLFDKSMPRLIDDPEVGSVSIKGGRKAKEGVDFISSNDKKFMDTNVMAE